MTLLLINRSGLPPSGTVFAEFPLPTTQRFLKHVRLLPSSDYSTKCKNTFLGVHSASGDFHVSFHWFEGWSVTTVSLWKVLTEKIDRLIDRLYNPTVKQDFAGPAKLQWGCKVPSYHSLCIMQCCLWFISLSGLYPFHFLGFLDII